MHEFQTNLARLEEQAKTRLKAADEEKQKRTEAPTDEVKPQRPGIINLTVENAGETDTGYAVFLDDAKEPAASAVGAREHALGGVAPGNCIEWIEAQTGGGRQGAGLAG